MAHARAPRDITGATQSGVAMLESTDVGAATTRACAIMAVIALDLGGTKLATAIFDADGEMQQRETMPLAGRGGTEVGELVVERYEVARGRLRASGETEPAAVGVTVPGIYRAQHGTVWAPNIPGWDDYPLLDQLVAAAGPDVPVVIDSDRAAYVLGETWRGAARGARHAIFLAVGTGIGAGIMVDGHVLRGVGDVAGAIGWLGLDRPFREPYVECGCFEYHASGPGLAKVALDHMEHDQNYAGELRDVPASVLTAEHVFSAAERGDRVARDVLDDAVVYWGMAAANLVSLFNPEVIVFGGGVFGPAAHLLDRVRAEATRWAQPIAIEQARFVASALGGDAGLYGAGRTARLASNRGSLSDASLDDDRVRTTA